MTRHEKTAVYFLIAMLALGLGVKFYKLRLQQVSLTVEATKLPTENIDIQKIVKEKQIIKINSATETDFTRLAGIGPALAERIVGYRNQNGNFMTIEDIKKVKGIGDKKYDAIKDYLVVD